MLIITSDSLEWDFFLKTEFPNSYDIYCKYEYFELFRKNYDVIPEAIFWKTKNVKIFFPHLIRKINNESQKKILFHDLTTPYGYGGPLIERNDGKTSEGFKDISIFYHEYLEYCQENRYVSEFLRFHPFSENLMEFSNYFKIKEAGKIIYVNLFQDINSIYQQMKKGTKYNIRTTEKRGCKVEFVEKPSTNDITDFLNCYHEMLIRNNAPEKYNFDRKFIEDTFLLLDAFMLKATYQGNCVGAYIYLKGPRILHNHLGGALRIKGIFPGDLIYMKAIEFAKTDGFEYFMLGGGTGTDDSLSLYNYKLNFSSLVKPFYVGKIVYLPEIYNKLVEDQNLLNINTDYFPKYRYNSDKTIV